MTIQAATRKAIHVGNGSATVFPFAFKVFKKEDVRVIRTSSAGVETPLVLGADYDVSLATNQASSPGGNVTYPLNGTVLASGEKLTVLGNIAITQPVELTNLGGFYPNVIETALDRRTIIEQQLQEQVDRAVKVPASSSLDPAQLIDNLVQSAANATTAATQASDALASFTARYLGAKTADPAKNNAGADLTAGTLYLNTQTNKVRVYTGMGWQDLGSIDSATVAFLGGLTGAVQRTTQAKLRDVVSVKDFGAVGDGVADDTAAFNAALTAASSVYVPSGTYRTTATITLYGSKKLVGAGRTSTAIQCAASGVPVVTLSAGNDIGISNLTLSHSVLATAGGHGIHAGAVTGQTAIQNVILARNWIGAVLGPCDYNCLHNAIVENNLSDGVRLTTEYAAGNMQWYLFNVLSQKNGGHGFFANALTAANGHSSTGTLIGCATYANSGRGFIAAGTASSRIASVRLYGCFFGEDAQGEVYLDTFSDTHKVSGCYIEIPGAAPTGPDVATPASGQGHGIVLTANNNFVSISDTEVVQCAWNGIVTAAPNTTIANTRVLNCGRVQTAGLRTGIQNTAATGVTRIVGCAIGNTSGIVSQQIGIDTTADNLIVNGSDLTGNTVSFIAATGALAASVIAGNMPRSVNT